MRLNAGRSDIIVNTNNFLKISLMTLRGIRSLSAEPGVEANQKDSTYKLNSFLTRYMRVATMRVYSFHGFDYFITLSSRCL